MAISFNIEYLIRLLVSDFGSLDRISLWLAKVLYHFNTLKCLDSALFLQKMPSRLTELCVPAIFLRLRPKLCHGHCKTFTFQMNLSHVGLVLCLGSLSCRKVNILSFVDWSKFSCSVSGAFCFISSPFSWCSVQYKMPTDPADEKHPIAGCPQHHTSVREPMMFFFSHLSLCFLSPHIFVCFHGELCALTRFLLCYEFFLATLP